jgi:hypothetical protein
MWKYVMALKTKIRYGYRDAFKNSEAKFLILFTQKYCKKLKNFNKISYVDLINVSLYLKYGSMHL